MQNLGRPLTIKQLNEQASSFYANTHRELAQLQRTGLVKREVKGRTGLIQLNPESPALLDYLLQVEAWRKTRAAAGRPDAALVLAEIAQTLSEAPGLDSAWLLEAERSIRINRWPLLLNHAETRGHANWDATIHAAARVKTLWMSRPELERRLASPKTDALRPWLANGLCILGADRHWLRWIRASRRGTAIWLTPLEEPTPADRLAASLAHYGYEEFGTPQRQTPILAIETLVIRVLHDGTARQRLAIGSILSKNDFDLDLLAYMADRDGLHQELQASILDSKRKNAKLEKLRGALLKHRLGDS